MIGTWEGSGRTSQDFCSVCHVLHLSLTRSLDLFHVLFPDIEATWTVNHAPPSLFNEAGWEMAAPAPSGTALQEALIIAAPLPAGLMILKPRSKLWCVLLHTFLASSRCFRSGPQEHSRISSS